MAERDVIEWLDELRSRADGMLAAGADPQLVRKVITAELMKNYGEELLPPRPPRQVFPGDDTICDPR